MVRTPSYDKHGIKKGTWTPEEDKKLMAYVTRYGYWNWRQLPKYAGLKRCGKSCRLRWMNYLRPNIKRGNYTKEEEDIILNLHASLGNRWSAIAAHLPGRTDNEIKNYWHTSLKKRMQKGSSSYEPKPKTADICQHKTSQEQKETTATIQSTDINPSISQTSSGDFSTITVDNMTATSSTSDSKFDDEFAFLGTYEEPIENFWTEPFLPDNFYHFQSDQFFQPALGLEDSFSPFLDTEIQYALGLFEQQELWS